MPRARNPSKRTQRRSRTLRQARGYFGTKSRHYYQAKIAVRRAGCYAYRDRRALKRDMRSLWITRISAACKMRGCRYSRFMNGLKLSGVLLNRKMLSQLAIEEPEVFDELVRLALESSRATPEKTEAAAA